MTGTVLTFPKHNSTGPKFRETPAHANRRLHISAEEGRRRLLAGTLPPRSVVLGSLHFSELDRPLVPPNLRVCGSMTLHNCHGVTKLGDGLQVDENADFTGTPLSRLPRRSHFKRNLDITDTNIKGVPRDLIVGGRVIVGEFASASLQALASRKPANGMSPVINF
jgi:hypothetical protein